MFMSMFGFFLVVEYSLKMRFIWIYHYKHGNEKGTYNWNWRMRNSFTNQLQGFRDSKPMGNRLLSVGEFFKIYATGHSTCWCPQIVSLVHKQWRKHSSLSQNNSNFHLTILFLAAEVFELHMEELRAKQEEISKRDKEIKLLEAIIQTLGAKESHSTSG